jgi:hypothetical protein
VSGGYTTTKRTHQAIPKTSNVLKLIYRLESYLNGLNMVPATALYRNTVILSLMAKALRVSRAVCVLIDADFHAEAFATSRTLIDIYFSVRYIGNKDTEKRAEKFVNYNARVRKEWQAIIMKHYPNTPPHKVLLDDAVSKLATEFSSKGYWAGRGQTKLMALEEDTAEVDEQGKPLRSEFDYDALYFWTSQFVHATVEAVVGHACNRGEVFRVRHKIPVEKRFARLSIANILIYLTKTFVSGFRAMNEAQPDDVLQGMYRMLRKMGGEIDAESEVVA